MSGGHFDYKQYAIEDIIESIESIIQNNTNLSNDFENRFSEKTIQEFKNAIKYLTLAKIYSHRIDWLISGDDGEETFHERLNEELRNNDVG
uniref:Uncharacterized protein n=1 Tax=viral metagenome TaxID=1070528 RepID=A0A6C0JVK7_9ZZZZ